MSAQFAETDESSRLCGSQKPLSTSNQGQCFGFASVESAEKVTKPLHLSQSEILAPWCHTARTDPDSIWKVFLHFAWEGTPRSRRGGAESHGFSQGRMLDS